MGRRTTRTKRAVPVLVLTVAMALASGCTNGDPDGRLIRASPRRTSGSTSGTTSGSTSATAPATTVAPTTEPTTPVPPYDAAHETPTALDPAGVVGRLGTAGFQCGHIPPLLEVSGAPEGADGFDCIGPHPDQGVVVLGFSAPDRRRAFADASAASYCGSFKGKPAHLLQIEAGPWFIEPSRSEQDAHPNDLDLAAAAVGVPVTVRTC
jgi:hypothetical protein